MEQENGWSSQVVLSGTLYVDRVNALHRVTIVLAGSLQGGAQLPSTLLSGGHLSQSFVLPSLSFLLSTACNFFWF